ncbi:MAG: DUF262 domain-containing protein [Candidatus Sumerlaeota bacterium]|nr:DUF262 domain-containing protein [Candidatus Sumerlaeota bacterium]
MGKRRLSDREIDELYDSGNFRLSQERNDFLLPQVLDFVRAKKWMNLRPEYQRRLVWDRKKKSLFIESLLMNVPIPPVFLYEWDLNRYEVMDGQQRLNTIIEFYENRLKLSGLETWDVLNGRTYADCPPRIQRGLDRRRISATVLLAESSGPDDNPQQDIRRQVFERLNTGGQQLNAQELRNCLHSGLFNDLIIELAGNRLFDETWEIPPYDDNIRGHHISPELAENTLFRRMRDCEIVLRFFAFRRRSKIVGAVKRILDSCMEDCEKANVEQIKEYRALFLSRLELAHKIFGDRTFQLQDDKKRWRLSEPLYDCVMIAVDRLFEHQNALVRSAKNIRDALHAQLSDQEFYELVVGRPNTAESIRERLQKVEDLFKECLK